ncbi:MAG: hypothetical protein JO163_08745 [Methylobacteriaceae bacterium]|nr:hypothetical protein [Methylobacteriaceae bacterium]MBV9635855.1 hypothetical protein [Methylobacteriaceae bacterium]MBV9702802.1 hypothetical protein [Methylobacteriaceae bacterium]
MSSLLTPGTIAGMLSFAGALSVAFRQPAFGAFLSDPTTAASATAVCSGIAALVAGGLKGLGAKG